MNHKEKRSQSGVYYRSKNQETGKFDNIVFEDLPENEQDEILDRYDKKQISRLCKILANTINEIGNYTDIAKP
jgi:hypothetical protein